MEYVVVIHADSPFGAFLLALMNKIGGASATMGVQGKMHPVIAAKDLEWGTIGFVQMTHLQNPDAADRVPRRIAVPAGAVLVALEKLPDNQQQVAQQAPAASLH